MMQCPFLCLMLRKFCALARYITVGKAFSLRFSILAPNALRRVLFRFLWKRLTNPHTGFNRDVLMWCLHLGTEILIGIGCNEIIVLIVLIGTEFLNEAMPFSLINVTQILGIAVWKTQGERPAVVFIVMIVHIVTRCLSEVMSFSLINMVQIFSK